jgi:hypothetical protein
MAYQPLSKLISQTPTSKELHITTDNWPKERKNLSEIIKDPQHPNFNWWFCCGITTKNDLYNLVEDYKGISSKLLKFDNMKEKDIKKWFSDKIKNKVHKELVIKSITSINNDVPRNYAYFKDIFKKKDVLLRILYTIFSQRYVLMESYSQTDCYTLRLISRMISVITKKQLDIYNTKLDISILKETLAYSILTKLLDLKISYLQVFPRTITINKSKVEIVKKKNKNFLLYDFFKFLFSTMFIKFLEDTELKKELLSHPQKKEIFSYMCDSFHLMIWNPHPFLINVDNSTNSTANYQKILTIIGNTLMDNDIITYMIYIIAYFCKYFKKKDISQLPPPVDPNKHPFLQLEFYGIEGRKLTEQFWNNPIPKTKVGQIREWLLQNFKNIDGSRYKRLDSVITIAKKKQTSKSYKNRNPVLFRYPHNLLNK